MVQELLHSMSAREEEREGGREKGRKEGVGEGLRHFYPGVRGNIGVRVAALEH